MIYISLNVAGEKFEQYFDLLVPGKRVHHDGGRLGPLQQVIVDNVHVLYGLVFGLAAETFPMKTIENQ